MAREHALKHGTAVAGQMEPVDDLCCRRCRSPRRVRIGAAPITANDRGRLALHHPPHDRLSAALGQQVHDAVSLEVFLGLVWLRAQ